MSPPAVQPEIDFSLLSITQPKTIVKSPSGDLAIPAKVGGSTDLRTSRLSRDADEGHSEYS